MSFISYVHTEVLELAAAKKLLSLIQKQSPPGGWKEIFGPNGSQKEIRLTDLTGEMLKEIDLTSYCSSLMLTSGSFQMYSQDWFPKSLHLGGDDWWPGSCGGDAGVQVIIQMKELNYPFKFSYWKDTEIGYAGRGYDECVKLCVTSWEEMLRFSLRNRPEFVIGPRPEGQVIDEYLNGLRTRFGFPNPESPGVLDSSTKLIDHSGFECNLVPGALGWDGARFSAMIRELVNESPMDYFAMLSTAALGTRGKFYGKIQNLTHDARELLDAVVRNNDFSCYEITYYPVGVESWVKREKARKKLREQTLHRELGIVTLDNGTEAHVSLILSKDGYVFYLNFDCDEDVMEFYETKLCQKTKWHSGSVGARGIENI